MVVDAGDTVTLAPLKRPGFQVYVVAPPVDKVAVLPAQMAVGVAIGLMVGVVLTDTLLTAVTVQPLAFVPVTVYCVVTTGLTVTVPPIIAPGFHV